VPDDVEAGSVGGDGADDPDASGGAGEQSGSADAGDGADGFAGSYDPYQFVSGTYTYEVLTPEGETGTLVWRVADVTDEQVTIEASLETPAQSFETRVTDDREAAYGSMYGTPLGPFVALGIASPVAVAFAEAEEDGLRVGDQWTATGPGGTVVYRVDRTERYAGLDCAVVEYVVNGVVAYESCVAPDDAMTRHLVVRNAETGETTVEMTLVDYRA
jgi:hypothetical protein